MKIFCVGIYQDKCTNLEDLCMYFMKLIIQRSYQRILRSCQGLPSFIMVVNMVPDLARGINSSLTGLILKSHKHRFIVDRLICSCELLTLQN